MNPQIRELMNKTLDDKFSHTWSTLNYEDVENFSENFSELLLQECINICELVASGAKLMITNDMVTTEGKLLHQGRYGGAKNAGEAIKHHFNYDHKRRTY